MSITYKVDSDTAPSTSMNESSSSNDSQPKITKVNTTTIDDTWLVDNEHMTKWGDFHSHDICSSNFLDIEFFNQQNFLCFNLLNKS